MKLVIVESPTKARKLNGFLGSDYRVESSVGHIVDLPKSGINVDVENGFKPKYEIVPDKKAVVSKLQTLANQAEIIYLASDPDREGEAIAWHLQRVLGNKTYNKKAKENQKFARATFHEITKEAVEDAIAHPGKVNQDLVNAQQARRVVDRLVGYEVSPILWRKVRRGLSAGRVQSVALRLIVEREKEIVAFEPEEYWEVGVILATAPKIKLPENQEKLKELLTKNNLPQESFFAELQKVDQKKYTPKKESDVKPIVADLTHAHYQIDQVEQKERRVSSYPPFTTSTLQQAAATRLGFTSKQTMTIAQQLYEEGLITYHRTDSFNLSAKSLTMARGYITKTYGENYLPASPRVFAKKSKNAQEAHEAIRVTDVKKTSITATDFARFSASHVKLYDLIWRRFVASQMAEAVYQQLAVAILGQGSQHQYQLKATGSTKKFDGWTKLFPRSEDKILPALAPVQEVYFAREVAEQKFTQPPARYNDASIIKKLEELGIGRPSTYASIISVIIDRGYVERQQRKFFATPVGITVTDFLVTNLPKIMEYDFTAEMEENLDEIARGKKEWQQVLATFYQPFSKQVVKVKDKAERVQVPAEPTGEPCPLCGSTEHGEVVIRQGKYGKFKSCSRFPDCKYTNNLQEVLANVTCPLCGDGQVVIKPSRWGKKFFGCSRYPKCNWASWSQPKPGDKISPKQWAEMQAAREARKKARLENKVTSKATKKTAKTVKKTTKPTKTIKKK